MNIFEIEIFGHAVCFIFLGNLVQAVDDLRRVLRFDNVPFRQHGNMRQTGANIMSP
jgi:hypothetical protein